MKINKGRIKNYKIFKDFTLNFNDDLNIIVGDNETGKSTLLEAVNLALTSQIAGRGIQYELSPYLFNVEAVSQYIRELRDNKVAQLPEIIIEIFLLEEFEGELAEYSGTNNSERVDCPGVYFHIFFNDDFNDEYKEYIKNPDEIRTIPIEYYTWNWFSFAHNTFKFSQLPSKVMLLDRSEQKHQNGSDRYISKIIDDTLEKRESASLSLLFRKQKEEFASQDCIKKINERIAGNKDDISDRGLSVSIDISARTNWDSNLTLYIDDVPFKYIGKGEQGSIRTKLALQAKMDKSHIVMIEEPETNLSYTNLNKLVSNITDACCEKQLIITTHNTFMMNKVGIDKVIFLNGAAFSSMSGVSSKTKEYFQKLPGYDTLRMIIAKRSILVEGPSDELIVQKAYMQLHGCLPLDDGIDVISVMGIAFKHFMEIAVQLKKEISIVSDNDGNYSRKNDLYGRYLAHSNIRLCIDSDDKYPTLEAQLANVNDLGILNQIFQRDKKTKSQMIDFMGNNKVWCALRIFESDTKINIPEYITNAIQ